MVRTRSTKLFLLVGAATLVVLIVLLSPEGSERTGHLSSRDLREIQKVIASRIVPWSSFRVSNMRSWPILIRKRWSLRITVVLEDNSSISRTRIDPDGIVTKMTFPSLIRYKANGLTGIESVIKKDGHWQIGGWGKESVWVPRFNHPASGNAGLTLQFAVERHCPSVPEPGCWGEPRRSTNGTSLCQKQH